MINSRQRVLVKTLQITSFQISKVQNKGIRREWLDDPWRNITLIVEKFITYEW
jgi:hypothetical protein